MADVDLPDPDEVEEQKTSTFTKVVALTVAAYAVVLAISSLGGSNAAKEMMLAQQEASNQWAYYQAKTIREHNCHLAWQRLELDLKERADKMPTEARTAIEAHLADLKKEEARYNQEKEEIKKVAQEKEASRNLNQAKDPYFDYAEVLLQISIVIASVAMLAGSRAVFGFSVVLAILGALLTINGFGLYVDLPFLG